MCTYINIGLPVQEKGIANTSKVIVVYINYMTSKIAQRYQLSGFMNANAVDVTFETNSIIVDVFKKYKFC